MIDTPSHPYSEQIDRNLREHFGPKVDRLERAAERFRQQEAALLRPDGTPKYAPQEHQERVEALLREYDQVGAEVAEDADEAIAEARQEIARLDGRTALDSLTEAELSRANTLARFISEDCETLPPGELARRVRAAQAGADRGALFCWARYLERRLEASRGSVPSSPAAQELGALARELRERFEDPKAQDKRRALEQRISSAQVLRGRVHQTRLDLDGTMDRARREMAARYRL